MWRWQRVCLLSGGLGFAAALAVDAAAALLVLLASLTPIFFCTVLLRAVALRRFFAVRDEGGDVTATGFRSGEEDLPFYSILVPVFREWQVVGELVEALDRLDWPRDRLDILFVTEAPDEETRQALERSLRPQTMRIIVVPPGEPQTKPRALMYALPEARGAYVVVFDAEDEPEPDQLRLAYARFRDGGQKVGCVQARLNIYNVHESWLARQFTLEYTALFDAILPALQALGLPVPLGGTSNHFRREVLENCGGWDPYNVTEDADLGIRLARLGWQVEVLPSTTWEEAPAQFGVWFRQRTRWLKGWMQTCLVHLRRPGALWRELGPRAFLGFVILLGGLILSALVHPLVYGVAAWSLWTGNWAWLLPGAEGAGVAWSLGVFNLAAAYVFGAGLAALAVRRRGFAGLARHAVLIPVYWLLISAAAYGALAGLIFRPYRWQKTDHSGRWRRRERGSIGTPT